jgi:geranylgeranyl diphosphate synthase type II
MNKAFLEKAHLVESTLDELIQDSNIAYDSLFQASRYSLLTTGGKRLRPILLLSAVSDLGSSYKAALYPAAALEMIHTYSLIHDDLPCMDNDDFRRGKPTLHKVYPEWQALLAGDFLLTFSFEILAKAPHLTAEQKVELITLFSSYSGAHGMIGGQVIDLNLTGKKIDIDSLKTMHRLKTGALIVLAIESAAVIANAHGLVREEIKKFAQKIGLAYQIVDDVLDVSGKQSDAFNNKTTYATLLGLNGAKDAAKQLYDEALNHLNILGPNKFSNLRDLAHHLVFRSV